MFIQVFFFSFISISKSLKCVLYVLKHFTAQVQGSAPVTRLGYHIPGEKHQELKMFLYGIFFLMKRILKSLEGVSKIMSYEKSAFFFFIRLHPQKNPVVVFPSTI